MTLRSSIVSQFEHPHGFWGSVAGWIMGNRPSNIRRNLWTLDLLEIGPGKVLRGLATRIARGINAFNIDTRKDADGLNDWLSSIGPGAESLEA